MDQLDMVEVSEQLGEIELSLKKIEKNDNQHPDPKSKPNNGQSESRKSKSNKKSSSRSKSDRSNGEDKENKDKNIPMTKVVVRRLPLTMTEEEFLDQVSPIPEHDYFYFVPADKSLEPNAFSRAYINFVSCEDVFLFRERFDGYVFVDAKGQEYPAMVEFAPYQKIPRLKTQKKKDPKTDTIHEDPEYQQFVEDYENEDKKQVVAMDQTLEEIEIRVKEKANLEYQSTPLLEFIKEKRLEKNQARKKKDEERRKQREEERKQKQILGNKDQQSNIYLNEDSKVERIFGNRDKNDGKQKQNHKRDEGKNQQRNNKPKEEREKKEKSEKEKERQKRRDEQRKMKNEKRKENRKEEEQQQQQNKANANEGPSGNVEEQQQQQGQGRNRNRNQRRNNKNDETMKDNSNQQQPQQQVNDNDESVRGAASASSSLGAKPKRYSDRRKEERMKREMVKLQEANQLDKFPEIIEQRSVVEVEHVLKTDENNSNKVDNGELDAAQKAKDAERKAKRDRERKERRDRVKNKERPALQIYRPGMGKFSSQKSKSGDEDNEPNSENRDIGENSQKKGKKSRVFYNKSRGGKNTDNDTNAQQD